MCLCPMIVLPLKHFHSVLYRDNQNNNADTVLYTSRHDFEEPNFQVGFGFKIYNHNL